MTSTFTTLAIYCLLILLASLLGGWIPIVIKLTHRRMEFAISFVAGVMLGVGVLHMLPHAIMARAHAEEVELGDAIALDHETVHHLLSPLLLWVVGGFLAMFFIERFFRYHHHDAAAAEDNGHEAHSHRHGMTWAGAAVGLTLHSVIEGIALAASVEVVSGEQSGIMGAAGLATFLVIFLHKPFDAMTLGTLMSIGGRSVAARHVANTAFALVIPLAAALFFLGLTNVESRDAFVAIALAFSAGTFLCISMSDLLPELQFHQHDRVKLSAALLAGLGLAWGISALESGLH